MKKLIVVSLIAFLAILLIHSSMLKAQVPQKISYQSVIRNSSGELIKSAMVEIKISILHGSVSGTVTYSETHSVSTNVNGLATLAIGAGTPDTGTFSAIDWSHGPYFLKVETISEEGTNYISTGTSEILSVPYALHSKTAETVTDSLDENDPLFTAWDKDYNDLTNKPANATSTNNGFMSSTDKIKLNGLQNANIIAGTGISVTGTYPDVTITNTASGGPHYIGELYGGGVIFWVDHTGEHGLIVSMVDQSTNTEWSNVSTIAVDTTNEWDGASNTIAILLQSGHLNSAAKLCADYVNVEYGNGTYNDWYLPSITELNHIWNFFYEVQKSLTNDGNPSTTPLIRTFYWSSSGNYDFTAWAFAFGNGHSQPSYKYTANCVRAVRAF